MPATLTTCDLGRLPLPELRRRYRKVRQSIALYWPDATTADLDAFVREFVCCDDPGPADWVAAALDALEESAGESYETEG